MTIPEDLRERLEIETGDEVVVREEDNSVVIEKAVTKERLAEGYRKRSERDRRLAKEMEGTSPDLPIESGFEDRN